MKSLIIFIKELPKPVSYTCIAYFGCLLLYNVSGSYVNAKQYLKKYRENALLPYEKDRMICEWEAVKYGAGVNFGQLLWDSIIWPVILTNNIIPFLVLTLNSK
jgi:hypothetical protein